MPTEECAICGDRVPFGTTTHVMLNPKHEEDIADHYVCRPCYDEHLEGLFATMEEDVAILREGDDADAAEPVGEGSEADAESDAVSES